MKSTVPQITPLSDDEVQSRFNGENTGESICAIQQRHHAEQLSRFVMPTKAEKLNAKMAELDRQRAELEAQQTEQAALASKWESLVTVCENLQREIVTGKQQFDFADTEAARLEYLHTLVWGQNGLNCDGETIVQLYARIAGARLLREDFPKWLAAKEAALEKATTDLNKFARENGIQPNSSRN